MVSILNIGLKVSSLKVPILQPADTGFAFGELTARAVRFDPSGTELNLLVLLLFSLPWTNVVKSVHFD